MSAFSRAVGALDGLSESELRQLHAIVGIRLGVSPSGSAQAGKPVPGNAGKAKAAKRSAAGASKKGNPSRKSQWATNPLYIEYSRLKKTVEKQAKEGNTSFAAVATPEAAAYKEALSQWLEAKSHFRDRNGPENESATGGAPVEQTSRPPSKGKAVSVPGAEAAPGDESSDSGEEEEDEDEAALAAAITASKEHARRTPSPPAQAGGSVSTANAVGRDGGSGSKPGSPKKKPSPARK